MEREYYNLPSEWLKRPLGYRLEAIRLEDCTGPCGQSQSTYCMRESKSATLKEAVAELARLRARVAELEEVVARVHRIATRQLAEPPGKADTAKLAAIATVIERRAAVVAGRAKGASEGGE